MAGMYDQGAHYDEHRSRGGEEDVKRQLTYGIPDPQNIIICKYIPFILYVKLTRLCSLIGLSTRYFKPGMRHAKADPQCTTGCSSPQHRPNHDWSRRNTILRLMRRLAHTRDPNVLGNAT
nr:hypothetical protein CFP56_29936 [Quercus suber]